jgi:acetyltransferase-like isoleucine patch superfamily enzyme
MHFGGLTRFGRVAYRLASWFIPPYKGRVILADMNERGFIAPSATIYHRNLRLGKHVFMGDRVTVFQWNNGGPVQIGDDTRIYGDTLFETGPKGSIAIGPMTRIQPGCQFLAYETSIQIGRDVGVSQNCAFYPYDHGTAPGTPISKQPLQTKGPIIIEDHAWLGVGVIVLDGVRIGKGAVIGAGAVVTHNIPDGAIAAGVPARVVGMRGDVGRGTAAS